MKNFTFKILAILFFTLLVNSVNAQTVWYKCYSDTAPSTLTADVDSPNPPGGTSGSWYSWQVAPGGPTLTIADDIDGTSSVNDANIAIVNWGAADIGLFTFTATEFNQCDEIAGDQTTVQINRVKPDVTNIVVNQPFFCIGEGIPIEVELTGFAGSTVTYTLSGGATGAPASPVLLVDDGTGTNTGTATVTVTPVAGFVGQITFTVASATYIAVQPDGSQFTSCINNTVTFPTGAITFGVGNAPTITPIQVVP